MSVIIVLLLLLTGNDIQSVRNLEDGSVVVEYTNDTTCGNVRLPEGTWEDDLCWIWWEPTSGILETGP